MAQVITGLMKLSRDVFKGMPVVYDNKSGEDAIKQALTTACGGEWNFYNFQKNKWDCYQVMSELLTLPIQETMGDVFQDICVTETIAEGDIKYMDVYNQDLFKVATLARGNMDIDRQRIYSKTIPIPTERLGVTIYDDFDRFISGRVNWAQLIDRVKISFTNDVMVKIYKALLGTYSAANANYNVSGVLDETKLLRMLKRVEGKTGRKVGIYGTQEALGMLTLETVSVMNTVHTSQTLRDDYTNFGYMKTWKGYPVFEIPTILIPGTDNFVSGTELFILPSGLEIMKVVFEGAPLIRDTEGASIRNDNAMEFSFSMKVGIGILMSNYYGIYELA